MKNRVKLADEIFNQLIINEKEAILKWKSHASELKLSSENLPVLDVLTCVYNAESYIAHAIESIVLQSYPNIHLVIVTDPCTDSTIDIIKAYMSEYSNITLIENTEHKGIINCFNQGLEKCTHTYIARMDLDDLIHPLKFEKQMQQLMQDTELAAISSYMKVFNEKFETRDVTYRDDFDLQKITQLFYSPISHAASIFRADVLKHFGYREQFKYTEDYDLWFQIMNEYKTAVYPEFLYLYRTHSNQVTNPRNQAIIENSWKGILENMMNTIGVQHSSDDLQFHIHYILLNQSVETLEEWQRYHNWWVKIIQANAQSHYFNHKKLKEFVFNNYWINCYNQFKGKVSKKQAKEWILSDINPGGTIDKIKSIIKIYLNK